MPTIDQYTTTALIRQRIPHATLVALGLQVQVLDLFRRRDTTAGILPRLRQSLAKTIEPLFGAQIRPTGVMVHWQSWL